MESASRPHVIVLGVYQAVVDARAAGWVVAGLRGFGESVLSLVPACFSEYLRVFHPAYRSAGSDRVAVAWAEIASANGMRMHCGVQLGSITGSERYEGEGQPGVFDQPPETGNIPPELLIRSLGCWRATPALLAPATSRSGTDGRGCRPRSVLRRRSRYPSAPITSLPGRLKPSVNWLTPCNPLGAPRSPNLWWPQDHAWCVATEVDLKTTYIGADRPCAEELISLPSIEAATVSPDLAIDWLSDTLNPRQRSA
jgi:hypothetical protein